MMTEQMLALSLFHVVSRWLLHVQPLCLHSRQKKGAQEKAMTATSIPVNWENILYQKPPSSFLLGQNWVIWHPELLESWESSIWLQSSLVEAAREMGVGHK